MWPGSANSNRALSIKKYKFMIKTNENNRVNARDIYEFLEIKTRFNDWIERSFDYVDAKTGKDFYSIMSKSTGGRPLTNYELTIDCAKEICLVQPNSKSKELRKWLICLSDQHETGLAFTTQQIEALMDLSRAMTLISIQESVERKHYAIYNDKYTWYKYRAALLGYDTKDIINAMKLVNKEHHSTRKSLIKLDANELIRVGVIDLMVFLGKTQDYATNVGNLCKSMAEKMKLGNIIWDDTVQNPLNINGIEVNDRKYLLNTSIKRLNK